MCYTEQHLNDICAVCGGRWGLHNNKNQACPKDINAGFHHQEYRKTVFSPQPSEQEAPKDLLNDPFIKKHLDRIWVKLREAKIQYHIKPMFGSLEAASIEHFLQTGAINGSFHNRLMEMMNGFRNRVEIDTQALAHPTPDSPALEQEIERLKGLLNIVIDGQSQAAALGWTESPEQIKEYMADQWQQFKTNNSL